MYELSGLVSLAKYVWKDNIPEANRPARGDEPGEKIVSYLLLEYGTEPSIFIDWMLCSGRICVLQDTRRFTYKAIE